jgi:broad specificity phosphatase PhoE
VGKILLARHGETGPNRERRFGDSDKAPLTDVGRQQARELAARVSARFKPHRILSSKFTRALETAGIIAAELNVPFEPLPDIHERDFGCLKGSVYERLLELCAEDPAFDPVREWVWAPPGGESRVDVQRRVLPVIHRVAAEYADREILIVCHGAVIQAVWAHLSGTWENSVVPPNCGMIEIDFEVEAGSCKFGQPRLC